VWQAVDIGSFDGNPLTTGYAYMNNDQGDTVGISRHSVGGVQGWCGFRTIHDLHENKLVSGDTALRLPALVMDGLGALVNSAGNGVDAIGNAVGSSDDWHQRYGETWRVETRATLWWKGDTLARRLPVMEPMGGNRETEPGRSQAYAVARGAGKLNIVGSSWATPTGNERAILAEVAYVRYPETGWTDWPLEYTHVFNLNDAHLTVVPTGWTLRTAEAINEKGWIVGQGSSPGHAQQAYVLIPQTLADQ
jgi:hypothetical protein